MFGDRQSDYRNAIIDIILNHGNFVDNNTIYRDIRTKIPINPKSFEPTNYKSYEIKYRGCVRKHISDMRREGIIETTDKYRTKRERGHYQRLLNPDYYQSLFSL